MARSFEANDVLYDLCDSTMGLLAATGAGVSVADGDTLRFVTATSERIIVMERAQERFRQGPCQDAFRTGKTMAVEDVSVIDAWPDFRKAAFDENLTAVAGIPLAVEGKTIGALNVYNEHARARTEDDAQIAEVVATLATAYLLRAGELSAAQRLTAQLQTALNSRIIIEQAKGMIARDRQISVGDAFELLRNRSRTSNVPLRSLAEAVVNLGLTLPPD